MAGPNGDGTPSVQPQVTPFSWRWTKTGTGLTPDGKPVDIYQLTLALVTGTVVLAATQQDWQGFLDSATEVMSGGLKIVREMPPPMQL